MSKVLFTGSFDPVTVGHEDIIARASLCFDEVYVVAFINPEKPGMFSTDERLSLLRHVCEKYPNVTVDFDGGMVVDYVARMGIDFILRAVRDEKDLVYELKMADYNRENGRVETLLLAASPDLCGVSSSAVRKRILANEEYLSLLPSEIRAEITEIAKNIPRNEKSN